MRSTPKLVSVGLLIAGLLASHPADAADGWSIAFSQPRMHGAGGNISCSGAPVCVGNVPLILDGARTIVRVFAIAQNGQVSIAFEDTGPAHRAIHFNQQYPFTIGIVQDGVFSKTIMLREEIDRSGDRRGVLQLPVERRGSVLAIVTVSVAAYAH